MKFITANKLNRLWKNGIKPIKEKVENKISSYADLMSNTVAGYMPDALAVKEGFNGVHDEFKKRNLPTYANLPQIGCSLDNTLLEVIQSMPVYSLAIIHVDNNDNVFQRSLPSISAGEVVIYKGSAARGYVEFKQETDGAFYVNNFYNSALYGWKQIAFDQELDAVAVTANSAFSSRVVNMSASTNDIGVQWVDNGLSVYVDGNCIGKIVLE